MATLGVNIDHVATIRQARGGVEPDPVTAAAIAELAGADGITVHLREDRRHIQDRDLRLLRETVQTRLNLEMAATGEMIAIALAVRPEYCTLVPEKRQELTTEGGLDVRAKQSEITEAVGKLRESGIIVSLFLDPDLDQIQSAQTAGADYIELHTGAYAEAAGPAAEECELGRLNQAIRHATSIGLGVNAGHGLNYTNIKKIASLGGIEEFNIGHSIISRALLVGLDRAVREMVALLSMFGAR